MNEIILEIKKYLIKNWWIFIIFFTCLILIFYTNTGNIFEALIAFLIHFTGDICMLVMGKYYNEGNLKKGGIYQILGTIIISLLGLYYSIFSGKRNYLISNFSYIFCSFKSYFVNIKGKSIRFLNWEILSFISVLLLFLNYYFGFINSYGILVQFLGLLIFPIGLVMDGDRKRYFTSVLGLFLMSLGSIIILYESYLKASITGIDISYSLLPLTVLVSYLKNVKLYFNFNSFK